MSRGNTYVDPLNDLINLRLSTLHTQLPARVTSVNYQENHLNCIPLITTRFSDESQNPFPELFEVPFFILSGNSGNARVTIPINVGDTVLVEFSERDLGGFAQSDGRTQVRSFSRTPHGLYPIMAFPCLYTRRSSKAVDPINLVIENESSSISMSPEGAIRVAGNVEITGSLRVNGVDVGDTHRHSEVAPGSATSGPPTPT